jgi:hypothetical protein
MGSTTGASATGPGGAAGARRGPAVLDPAEDPAAEVARILGSMRARAVAAVLEDLEDARIQEILDHMSDRKVAEIIARLDPGRAAALLRGRMDRSGGPTPGGAR